MMGNYIAVCVGVGGVYHYISIKRKRLPNRGSGVLEICKKVLFRLINCLFDGNYYRLPRSFILLCEIGFLELRLCTIVCEEDTEENHNKTL